MDDKKLAEIFDDLLRVGREVRNNYDSFDPYLYAEIFKRVNTTREIPNTLKVNEALTIMLQVVHSFKCSIDMYWNHIDDDDSEGSNKRIEDIINNRVTKVEKNPIKVYYSHLVTLLLEVLYEINGAHYRTRDPDFASEDELDEILKMPNWSYEFDSAITKSLLLPLYYSTHQGLEESKG